MKQKDKSVVAQLRPLISDGTRVEAAVRLLRDVLKSENLSDPKSFQTLDKWAVDDLDRLLAALVAALRLQTFSIHDPRIRELRRPLKKREGELLRKLGVDAHRWIDHVTAMDLEDDTYFVAEPYELNAEAFADFEKMRQDGWLVRVFPPLATYFPTQAIPVLFRQLRAGEVVDSVL